MVCLYLKSSWNLAYLLAYAATPLRTALYSRLPKFALRPCPPLVSLFIPKSMFPDWIYGQTKVGFGWNWSHSTRHDLFMCPRYLDPSLYHWFSRHVLFAENWWKNSNSGESKDRIESVCFKRYAMSETIPKSPNFSDCQIWKFRVMATKNQFTTKLKAGFGLEKSHSIT